MSTGEYHIDGWHLDKRISAGHLLTTLAIIVSFVTWMLNMETQVAAIEALTIGNNERIIHVEQIQAQRTARVEVSTDGHYNEIIRRLEKLDDRMANHMVEHLNEQRAK